LTLADLINREGIFKAIAGSEMDYVTICGKNNDCGIEAKILRKVKL